MDPISARMVMAAAGAGAAGSGLTVEDVFSTFLYEGNGTNRSITNGIDLAGEGGMVWFKRRDAAKNNMVQDTERGVNVGLITNSSSGETPTEAGGVPFNITSFNSDGFDLGTGSLVNANGSDLVSWTFRKAPGFFDVVTYTGDGVAGRTVSHNLGSVPGMIWVKSRTNGSGNWAVYHRSQGATRIGYLDESVAWLTQSDKWNNTAPTATEFTVGDYIHTNGSGEDFVAYIFAHDDAQFGPAGDESIIECGSYIGNGSTTGPIIDLGWEPQWVMLKNADNTGNWVLLDTARGIVYNGDENYLAANVTLAEAAAEFINLLPTGFQLTTNITPLNTSGDTYIYMAIRRPDPAPAAGTDFFQVRTRAGTGSLITSPIDFNADSLLIKRLTSVSHWLLTTRGFRDYGYIQPSSTQTLLVNTNRALVRGDEDSTVVIATDTEVNASSSDYVDYIFKRARGAFDTMFYTGTGATQAIDHGLGAVPKMIWVKGLSSSAYFYVYHEDVGNGSVIPLSDDDAFADGGFWSSTSPTSTQFTVGSALGVNKSNDPFVAYLFGNIPDIIDIGSYTGTGTLGHQIDCGFTAGARFVLIKCTTLTPTNWRVYDTARGITVSSSPELSLNSTQAEITGNDLKPYSPGFEINTASNTLNALGETYIYMAIA